MTTVLVTGAQGFLGRYLCAALREADPSSVVVGMGRSAEAPGFFVRSLGSRALPPAPLPTTVGTLLATGFTYEQASVYDAGQVAAVLRRHRPKLIFHLAGALRPVVAAGESGDEENAIASLIDAVADEPGIACRLVLGSSGAVYGAAALGSLPLHESHACHPVDPYGAGKLRQETLAIAMGRRISLEVVVARLFNLIGPGQDDVHACGRFAALISAGAPLLHVRSLHATRDFIDVRDAARALILLAQRGMPGMRYNVARGIEVAMSSLLHQMLVLGDYQGEVLEDLPDGNLPDLPRHVADIECLRRLGFAPRHELSGSLRDLLAYNRGLRSPATPAMLPD